MVAQFHRATITNARKQFSLAPYSALIDTLMLINHSTTSYMVTIHLEMLFKISVHINI